MNARPSPSARSYPRHGLALSLAARTPAIARPSLVQRGSNAPGAFLEMAGVAAMLMVFMAAAILA